jgi:EpsI family protein
MRESSLKRRALFTAGLLGAAFLLLHGVSHGEKRSPRRQLSELPSRLGSWMGQDSRIEPRILKALGVDDYLSRVYSDGQGHSLGIYVGYYASQRTGDTIHSPKNCLPGAGWEPVRSGLLTVEVPGQGRIVVNEYVIEKGLERQLVLYWYQGRGRVVASEYWGKIWLVTDAITRNRTDGALVRIISPMGDGETQALALARETELLRYVYPRLTEFIPD